MLKKKILGKRIVSLMLAICVVTLNMPAFFQNGAEAAENMQQAPEKIAAGFKTKDEVLAYNTSGADTSHKVYFGEDSGDPREWWLVGKEESGGTSYLTLFNNQLDVAKNFGANNDYTTSSLKSRLDGYASNTSYFSAAEQALMREQSLSFGSKSASVKLYAPYYNSSADKVMAKSDSLPIALDVKYYPDMFSPTYYLTNTANPTNSGRIYTVINNSGSNVSISSNVEANSSTNRFSQAVTQIDATNLAFAALKVTNYNKWQEVTGDETLQLKFKDTSKYQASLAKNGSGASENIALTGEADQVVMMVTDQQGNTYVESFDAEMIHTMRTIPTVMIKEELGTGMYHVEVWAEKTIDGVTYIGGSSDGANTLSFDYAAKADQTDVKIKLEGTAGEPSSGYSIDYEDNLKITPVLENNKSVGTVTYTLDNNNGVATLNSDNTISINKVGTFSIKATIADDGVYNTKTLSTKTITINKGTQAALEFDSSNPSQVRWVDGSANIKFKGGSGTGAYSIELADNTCEATATGSNYSSKISFTQAGSVRIILKRAGDDNYNDATPIECTLTVNRTNSSLIIGTGNSIFKYKDDWCNNAIDVTSSGFSGTANITIESENENIIQVQDPSTVTAENGMTQFSIKPVSVGRCKITVTRAETNKFNEAVAEKYIDIIKGDQDTLEIIGVNDSYAYGTTGIKAQTTGGTGDGAVTFETVSGSEYGTVAPDGTLTFKQAGGSFEIKASKAADNYYDGPKESETKTITVTKADQAKLNINAKSNYYYSDSGKIKLTTTGGNGTGAVTFETVGSNEYGEVSSDGTLTFHKAFGSFKVKATKAADTNYNEVTSQEVNIYVDGYEQTGLKITGPNADKNYTFSPNGTIQLKVEGAKENPQITYSVSSSNNAVSIDPNSGLVTMHKAGTFTVTANLQKTTGYAAKTVSETFTINKLDITEGIKATIKEVTHVYDGKAWDPTSKIEVKYGDEILANGTDYKVTLPEDMTSLGQKEITITLTHNDYTGTAKVYGEIVPDPDVYGEGAAVGDTGIINYVSSNGTTSAVVNPNGMTWLKEESGGSSAWYGIDNSENIFPENSMFYVRWLSEEDGEDYIKYYNQIDHRYIKEVESGRIYVFLVGVKNLATGEEITNFNGKELNLLIQIGEDWDKDDIQAVFIKDNANEIIGSTYKNAEYPGGTGDFASLTLNHFSPYIVYDKLTEQDQNNPSNNTTNNDKNQTNNANDNEESNGKGYVTSGDTSYKAIAWFAGLALASGCTALVLGKKRRKDS